MPSTNPFAAELIATAKQITYPGKGILAADESTGTIGSRFQAISVENNHENRVAYRELLFTAPGIEEHISGVIMFDETARDSASDGRKFCDVLKSRGILCGIKVDTGLVTLLGTEDETATQGLDGLGKRCAEYYNMGIRFAKWRAVLKITSSGCPSALAVRETAHTLARYASICQQNGLVPIVEPEILQDGDHSIDVCRAVSERVFAEVMSAMSFHGLLLEGTLLKPNMVTPGASYAGGKATPAEVAFNTVLALSRSIAPSVCGVCFLSGGSSEEEASAFLNAMNVPGLPLARPWALTFSYGRALQKTVLKVWGGKAENAPAAQAALLERARANGSAALGKYAGGSGSNDSDFVANYRY